MIRPTVIVQADTCPACQQPILVTNWDDLQGITVSPYRADPTALTEQDETVCIIIDRPTYLLEQTATKTWRLSLRDANNTRRASPHLIAVIPHHSCGARYSGHLDLPDPATRTPQKAPY